MKYKLPLLSNTRSFNPRKGSYPLRMQCGLTSPVFGSSCMIPHFESAMKIIPSLRIFMPFGAPSYWAATLHCLSGVILKIRPCGMSVT